MIELHQIASLYRVDFETVRAVYVQTHCLETTKNLVQIPLGRNKLIDTARICLDVSHGTNVSTALISESILKIYRNGIEELIS